MSNTLKASPPTPNLSLTDSPFIYRDGQLTCEEVPLTVITAAVDTPVYVYSRADLERRARAFLDTAAAGGPGALVCYAVKANGNPALLALLRAAGLGADVTAAASCSWPATPASIRGGSSSPVWAKRRARSKRR